MSLQPIVLDTDKTTPIYEVPLKIRQGDTGDELQVTLGKSFQKYTDLSTIDVELIAKTPDQRLIKQAVTDKSGNTFKVKFPDEMYTNVGVFRNMYFKIGDDSTSDIKLVVLQGIGSIKEAGSYIDDFETLIKEAESYVLALKDFSDTGNAKIDDKVAELTGKMQIFVDKAKEDLDAAKAAWSTFQNSSQTAFTDAQDKRASDFNSQKAGFETDFNKQKTDFENRFKALLTNLQGDYDDFKALINKEVADFNKSLDSLDAQATDVKNKFDALKAQLDLAAQNISGVRTNLLLKTYEPFSMTGNNTINQFKQMYALSKRIEAGTTITISFDAVSTAPTKLFILNNAKDGGDWFSYITDTVDTTKKHYVATVNTISFADLGINIRFDNIPSTTTITVSNMKLELGSNATDYSLNPQDIATDGSVQTAIKNALDKADYSTTAEVDSKIATGVGQAKTYAEQSIKDIVGAAPATLDTIAELATAVTGNKTIIDSINNAITAKAEKSDVTNLSNKVSSLIVSISEADYQALETAGKVDPTKLYVTPEE